MSQHIKDLTTAASLGSTDLFVVSNGTDDISYKQTASGSMAYNSTASLSIQPLQQTSSLYKIPVYDYPIQQNLIGDILHQSTEDLQYYNVNVKGCKLLTNKSKRDFKTLLVGYLNLVGRQESVGVRKVGAQLVTIPKEACDLSKDFTIIRFIKINETRTSDATSIISKLNGLFLYSDTTAGDRIVLQFGNLAGDGYQSTAVIDTGFTAKYKGKNILLTIQKTGLNVLAYINNILVKSITLSTNIGNNANNFIDYVGGTTDIIDTLARFFNYAFTQSDRDYYWNNGRPDLVPVRHIDKYGSNTNKMPSQMKKGKIYKITNNTSSDFTLYGSPNNLIGTIFVCNNDFNITNNNGYVIQLGCVADFNKGGIVYNSSLQCSKWIDSSYNQLHATVSGNPLIVKSSVGSVSRRTVDLGQESVGVRVDSRSQYVELPHVTGNNFDFNASQPFSLYWFGSITELPSSSGTGICLLGKCKDNVTNGYGLELYNHPDVGNMITAALREGANLNYTSNGFRNITLNSPIFIIAVSNGVNIKLYVNSMLVVSFAITVSNIKNTEPFSVISRKGIIANPSTNAKITTLRNGLFNYALSASEIALLWNNGRPDLALVRDSDKWGSNTDINSGYNFTSGWGTAGTCTINSSTKFTVTDIGGVYKTYPFDLGKRYKLKLVIKNSAQLTIRNMADLTGKITIPINANFTTYEVIYTPVSNVLYLTHTASGNSKITTFEITQIGSVADYSPASIVTTVAGKAVKWKDLSTNQLHATVSNSPDINTLQLDYTNQLYLQKTITQTVTGTHLILTYLPYNYVIDSVVLLKTASSASTLYLTVNNVIISNTISTDAYDSVTQLNNLYGFTLLSHTLTGTVKIIGTSGTYNITIIYKRVNV